MGVLRQTWTLTRKNLLIVLWRHRTSTIFRAFVLPIIFTFFISYAKNFFIPPADFGIGHATPVRSLSDALANANAGHDTVAFVNNGFTGGDISNIINELSETVRAAGFVAPIVSDETELLSVCKSSLRGATRCYAAANFHSSTTQGLGGIWNYTLHADGSLGTKIFVNHDTNDQEIYILPFQHAIDSLIATSAGKALPLPSEYPFTYEDNAQRAADIVRLYQGTVISILAVAFFLGILGVTYQLTGHMASERELGMSQLIEAMMPNKRRWEPQVARILAYHAAFSIIYMPAWVLCGAIVSGLVFPDASYAITIIYHILLGLALTSYSIFFAAFFKKAQLSGITATIVSIVLAIIAQIAVGGNGSTGAVAILSLLFPSCQYVFYLIMMAKFQQVGRPMNLVETPPNSDWAISAIVLWVFAIIQIIVFPILGALVERALYGTGSTDRKLQGSETSSGAHVAVKLTNFNKIYGPSRIERFFQSCFRRKSPQVHAVKDLTLDVVQGQIAILLGANGSGKSTTLDAIAGLHPASSGTIAVDGRGGLGLCPQKNVLWDDLSVLEHVRIFNSLKTTGGLSTKTENEELIAACDLAIKQDAKSKTLSGGQKRKLQLAMMFTGGSRVCCVDEVSSGIDPLARRKIWDILLNERGRRTILLTTHFLDEADILSDCCFIMSKGILRAQGSAVELKHTLGGGYRVFVTGTSFKPAAQFADVPKYPDYDQTVYQLSDSSEVSRFIAGIQDNVQYRVQGPTMQDVFLRIADETKDDFGGAVFDKGPAQPVIGPSDSSDESKSSENISKGPTLDLRQGRGTSWLRQAWVLFCKRWEVLRHNYLPYLSAVIIPIIAGGLTTRFLQGFAGLGCSPEAAISVQSSYDISDQLDIDLVYGPTSLVPVEALTLLIPNLNASSLHAVNTLVEFNQYIGANFANVTPGGFFLGATPTFAYLANYQVSTAALVQTIVDNLVSGTTISTQYQSFALPWAPGAGSTLQLILYFGLAMSAYPAFFALYPTAERLRNVRALHYSNGVRSAPLWSAYVLFDFVFVMLVSIIVTVLFAALWSHWYGLGYLFVVFFLYGLTSVAFSYVVSLFVTSQLAAFALAAGTQCVLFLIYLVAYLCIITYAPASLIDHDILLANWIISIFSPSSSLLRGLLLSLNEFSVTCDGFALASNPGNIKVYGGPILYLIIQFMVLMAFLIWWDAGGRPSLSFIHRSSKQSQDIEDISPDQNAEILEEVHRVEKSPDSALRVLHLTKSFGSNTAVDNVSFSIHSGETFALLGPNGAGKSTTISLIRGDLRPSSHFSDPIFVEGVSLTHNRTAARNHLGVCPQFDAMDALTVRGHLAFYAKVRGVKDVEHNVNEVMRAVGITQYADRMAVTLSGGNKRKTSLAIALMGNPNCLLLDEPSSGMDAAAKRVMWRVLGGIAAGRALLITTHSMEEADALANRAGILAQRMLAIGTADELRKAHGDALNVHLVAADAPRTSDADMQRMREWVQRNIAGATVEERTYHGQLRFSVPNTPTNTITNGSHQPSSSSSSQPTFKSGHTIRALFDILETHKEELGVAYYSVAAGTLDQIFLNVVRKHNIAEENSHAETKGEKRAWWWPFGGKKEVKKEERRSLAANAESSRGSEEEEGDSVVEEVTVGKGSGASRS